MVSFQCRGDAPPTHITHGGYIMYYVNIEHRNELIRRIAERGQHFYVGNGEIMRPPVIIDYDIGKWAEMWADIYSVIVNWFDDNVITDKQYSVDYWAGYDTIVSFVWSLKMMINDDTMIDKSAEMEKYNVEITDYINNWFDNHIKWGV